MCELRLCPIGATWQTLVLFLKAPLARRPCLVPPGGVKAEDTHVWRVFSVVTFLSVAVSFSYCVYKFRIIKMFSNFFMINCSQ